MPEARQLTAEPWLRDDLTTLTSNLAPLWDGKAKLTVHSANEEEIAAYMQTTAVAEAGELVLAYLVELD